MALGKIYIEQEIECVGENPIKQWVHGKNGLEYMGWVFPSYNKDSIPYSHFSRPVVLRMWSPTQHQHHLGHTPDPLNQKLWVWC